MVVKGNENGRWGVVSIALSTILSASIAEPRKSGVLKISTAKRVYHFKLPKNDHLEGGDVICGRLASLLQPTTHDGHCRHWWGADTSTTAYYAHRHTNRRNCIAAIRGSGGRRGASR